MSSLSCYYLSSGQEILEVIRFPRSHKVMGALNKLMLDQTSMSAHDHMHTISPVKVRNFENGVCYVFQNSFVKK